MNILAEAILKFAILFFETFLKKKNKKSDTPLIITAKIGSDSAPRVSHLRAK